MLWVGRHPPDEMQPFKGTVWIAHTLGRTWNASLPHARCFGLYEILFGGRSPGLREFFSMDFGSLATNTEAP